MASEADSSKSSDLLDSMNYLQQESKLVRSASESSNLAHCWAREKFVTSGKTSTAATSAQKVSRVSGSISLQEISSLLSGNTTIQSINDNTDSSCVSHKTTCNPSERNSTHTSSSASSKQYDVQIPPVVLEEKEVSSNTMDEISELTQGAHESNRGASRNPPDVKDTSKDRSRSNDDDEDDGQSFFFWDLEEAKHKQVEQIGASACGATAIINVMNVLDLHPDLDTVASAVQTNLRAEDAPLPEYLFSRSVAGATHEALIEGLDARFFAFYPKKKVDVKQWLASWMRQGVVPLATLNLQAVPVGEDGDVHDAWHHQMIYGVDKDAIHMCNPIISETEEHIQAQLCSPSVLLVRRFDVLKRWHKDTNLSSLALHEDPRWRDMDVLGQAVNMLLEDPPSRNNSAEDDAVYEKELTDWFMHCHVRIPAAYTSGITLCVRKDNQEAYHRLMESDDLPLDDGD